jgi:hypothetical protein
MYVCINVIVCKSTHTTTDMHTYPDTRTYTFTGKKWIFTAKAKQPTLFYMHTHTYTDMLIHAHI